MSESPYFEDLVWAKMKRYPAWPGRVIKTTKNKKGFQWVYFFGSDNFAWIEDTNIFEYEKFSEKYKNGAKMPTFVSACKSMDAYIEQRKKGLQSAAEFDKSVNSKSDDVLLKKKQSGGTPNKSRKSDYQSVSEADNANTSLDEIPQKKKQTPAKARKSGSVSEFEDNASSEDVPQNKSLKSFGGGTKRKTLLRNETPTKKIRNDSPRISPELDENGTSEQDPFDHEMSTIPAVLDKPILESNLVMSENTVHVRDRNIMASDKVFGFLGLGIMGSRIVRNLLNSGHKVNVWNRTPDKCEDLKNYSELSKVGRIKVFSTPYDILQNSDIVFSCLPDPRAAREIVVGNCGVAFQAEGPTALAGKSYVEMTSIDPDTSKTIAAIIEGKGGRYLEAQLQGSKQRAEEGNLVILTAGDRTLFMDCQSCFKAIGVSAIFLGVVGMASKMNLCISMALGISLAGLAESMALVERCGLSSKDFLDLFKMSEGGNSYLQNKGQLMNSRHFGDVEQALCYMQKDISLCLELSSVVKQSMPVAAATNEAYKRSRKSGYDNFDVASVYMNVRD